MRSLDHDNEFVEFATAHEARLRRALVAAYGHERGAEAVAEAFAYAWEHWSRVREMSNPLGYLYRVGQSKTRPRKLARARPSAVSYAEAPLVEPGLGKALATLTEAQRLSVVLVFAFEWTPREVAELTGVSVSTVRTHVERGLQRLRADLEVYDSA